MTRNGVLAGLATLALIGVAPATASAAAPAPRTVQVADGVQGASAPRLAAPTVMAADQTTVFEAESVTVTVRVTAPGATPTGTVAISEAGAVLGSGAVSGGTAVVSLPRTLAVGRHPLTAAYSGDGSVDPGTTSFVLTVAKADPVVAIDSTTPYGSPVQVSVVGPSVPDPQFPGTGSNGALPAGTVTLYEGTRELGSAPVRRLTSSMTASNYGVAGFTVPARLLRAGGHELTAVYSGSDQFNGAQVTRPVTVTRAESSISARTRPAQPRRGKPVRLGLEATNQDGAALAGRAVVEVDGRSYAVELRRGEATVKLRGLGRGRHVARVLYRGSDDATGSRTRVAFTVR